MLQRYVVAHRLLCYKDMWWHIAYYVTKICGGTSLTMLQRYVVAHRLLCYKDMWWHIAYYVTKICGGTSLTMLQRYVVAHRLLCYKDMWWHIAYYVTKICGGTSLTMLQSFQNILYIIESSSTIKEQQFTPHNLAAIGSLLVRFMLMACHCFELFPIPLDECPIFKLVSDT